MKTILYLLQKEFIQVMRNKTMLIMIFVLPLVQLLILVNAATFEMKNIDTYVVDKDLSSTSREMINKFQGSPFYNITGRSFDKSIGEKKLLTDEADLIITIPTSFEHDLRKENKADVQLMINAINGSAAGLINAYTTAVIADYNQSIISQWMNQPEIGSNNLIELNYSYWYNPEM